MIYIILNIVASVLLLGIFKLFDKFKINSFHAIIVNYFAASVTGLIFSKNSFDINQLLDSKWIYVSIPLGFLLISIFHLISLTTRKLSMSIASVANKMSVVLPVLFSVIVLNESLNALKITGIVLALIALYFATYSKKDNTSQNKQLIYLPILVFIGSGLIDVAINATKAFYVHNDQDGEMFTVSSFAFAFIIGLSVIGFQKIRGKFSGKSDMVPFEIKSIAGGILLGIPNYFSIFFIIKALESNVLSSAQIFPLLNISNVVLSTLIGYIIFKEKLSAKNLIGISIALIAIALITL
jgi:drug/metabolite transporter (DMT)-like permease